MAAIVETIVGDRRLQLGNEEFVRQMLIGSTWTKIRIGLQVAINGNLSFSSGGLTIGVCQGFTNTYRSAATTDYVGVQLPQNIGTITYNAGPPSYYSFPSSCIGLKRTGNTTTLGSNGNVNSATVPPVSTGVRAPIYVDVLRAAGSYTFTFWVSASSTFMATAYDQSPGQFLSDLQNELNPIWGQNNMLVGSAGVGYSGAAQHDCLSINWTLSNPTIEISNLAVLRYY